MLLASAGEHHVGLVQGAAPRAERQPSGALLGGAVFGGPVAQGDPGRSQFGEFEVVPVLLDRAGGERPRELGQVQGDLADDRPVVPPGHGCQERFAAEHVPARGAAARSYAEQHHPPGAVGALDQVGVPGVLDGVVGAAVGEDRVGRARLERALGRTTAGDRDTVAALGAALGDEQVPVVADPVQVRRLRGLGAGSAGPEPVRCAVRLPGGRVDTDLRDPGDRAPAGAVLVPDQVGIDAGDTRCPDGVRPGSGGVGGRDDQVAAALAAVGDDQPEAAVVVAQGGGVDAAGGRHGGGQTQLVRPVQDVADLPPVHQVTTVEEGTPGKYSKLEQAR